MPRCSDRKDKVTIPFWSLKSNVLEDKHGRAMKIAGEMQLNTQRPQIQSTFLLAATFSKGIEVDDIDFGNIFHVTENLIITIPMCRQSKVLCLVSFVLLYLGVH